jgi:hypothetical protein
LNVEIMSASSSTSRILLGLTALLLPLVVRLLISPQFSGFPY